MPWMATFYCVRFALAGKTEIKELCYDSKDKAAKVYQALQMTGKCLFLLASEVTMDSRCRIENLLKVETDRPA